MKSPGLFFRALQAVLTAVAVMGPFPMSFAQSLPGGLSMVLPSENEFIDEMIRARLELLYKERADAQTGELLHFTKSENLAIDGITPIDRKTSKVLTLTFDDGPNPETTPLILAALRRHGIRATFFVLGAQALRHRGILEQIMMDGHTIGQHSFNHPNFTKLSNEITYRQISFTDMVLRPYMNAGPFFRYPYGRGTKEADAQLSQLRYGPAVGWHIDTCDYAAQKGYLTKLQARACGASAGPIDFSSFVVQQIDRVGGGIVLFHDTNRVTAQNFDTILTRLVNKGYRFTSLTNERVYPNLNQSL